MKSKRKGTWVLISVLLILGLLAGGFGCAAPATPTVPPKPATPSLSPVPSPAPTPKPVPSPTPSPSPTPAPVAKTKISWGSAPTTSAFYAWYVGTAVAVNKRVPEVEVTLVAGPGTEESIKRLVRNDIQIAQSTTASEYEAYKGLQPWPQAYSDLRQLQIYSESILMIVVSEGSGVKTVADLNGKPFNPGLRGSAAEKETMQYLDFLGIKPNYQPGSLSDAVAAMKDRRIVGFAKYSARKTQEASLLDVQTSLPATVISLTDAQIAKLSAQFPLFKVGTIPAGLYKGIGEIKSWMVGSSNITLKGRLLDDLVYKILKGLWDGYQTDLVAAYPGAKGDNMAQLTIDNSLIPLHVSAIKLFRELGFKIPDALIPPEAK